MADDEQHMELQRTVELKKSDLLPKTSTALLPSKYFDTLYPSLGGYWVKMRPDFCFNEEKHLELDFLYSTKESI